MRVFDWSSKTSQRCCQNFVKSSSLRNGMLHWYDLQWNIVANRIVENRVSHDTSHKISFHLCVQYIKGHHETRSVERIDFGPECCFFRPWGRKVTFVLKV